MNTVHVKLKLQQIQLQLQLYKFVCGRDEQFPGW
jgi:hypothetical protein